MRGCTERRAIGTRVKVGDIATNGDMRGEGNTRLVSCTEQRIVLVPGILCEKCSAHRLAQTDPVAGTFSCGAIQESSSFIGSAKRSFTQGCVHVFRCRSDHCDLRIVNQHGSVSRDGCDKAALHEIDDHRCQSRLDYMTADAPNDRLM